MPRPQSPSTFCSLTYPIWLRHPRRYVYRRHQHRWRGQRHCDGRQRRDLECELDFSAPHAVLAVWRWACARRKASTAPPLVHPFGRRWCRQSRRYLLRAPCTPGGTGCAHGACEALAHHALQRPCGGPAAVRSHPREGHCGPLGWPMMAILGSADTNSSRCVRWCAEAGMRRPSKSNASAAIMRNGMCAPT